MVATALAVSVGLLLSACDGGEDPSDPPTTQPSSSVSPSEPVSETTEPVETATPPEVEAPTPAPEAATDDHIGAIYAARYFLDLYAYMNQSGDTAPFAAMSSSECAFCADSIEGAEELHSEGGWVAGGAITVDVADMRADYPTESEPSYLVRFAAVEGAAETHHGDGSVETREQTDFQAVIALQFVDGRFVVMGFNSE